MTLSPLFAGGSNVIAPKIAVEVPVAVNDQNQDHVILDVQISEHPRRKVHLTAHPIRSNYARILEELALPDAVGQGKGADREGAYMLERGR